jgi:hypothetical protein
MQSTSDDTTACDSPVPSASSLPTPTPPSLSSPLPPRPAPQPSRRERRSRQPPARRDLPVQSQIQHSVRQAINISFPARLIPALPPFTVSEPGLLGKKVSHLYELIDPSLGYCASNSNLTFGGLHLNNELTISDYGVISGDTIQLLEQLRLPLRGRKPVIYLYPPSSLADVTVELALASSWRFSAVHPPPRTTVPPGEPHTAQALTWTVAAEPDGTLVDKTSGMEVSYLYWEAM